MLRTRDQVFGGAALRRFGKNPGELNSDALVSAIFPTPTRVSTRCDGQGDSVA